MNKHFAAKMLYALTNTVALLNDLVCKDYLRMQRQSHIVSDQTADVTNPVAPVTTLTAV